MSFLDDLLNPAPSSLPDVQSSKPQSGSPSAHTQLQRRRSSEESQAQVKASYEAASALTALAASGSTAYTPHYATSPATHFASPALPPLSTLPHSARRASYNALPPLADRAALPGRGGTSNGGAHTLPSPTSDLDQYRSSRSPDELRRQSFGGLHSFRHHQIHEQEGGGGPVLAPLLGALATAPPASADKGGRRISNNSQDAFLARATSSDVENAITSLSQSQIHSHPHPQSITTSAEKASKMEETGTEIEQPAPSQIREPSAAAPEAVMTPQAPEPAERKPLPSEPAVKDEPMGTPMGGTPIKEAAAHNNEDEDTLKAIEAAKNEFGVRAAMQKAQPSIEEPSPPPSVAVTAAEESKSKKRPAPKVKKGQATVKKPPSKKRKVEDDTRLSAAASRVGGGGKKSKSNTPALGSSPAPGSVVSADNESAYASDASSNDENEAYCICRRGDNHTWMIACDGGCEDWFHGKCVNILEDDGELIDKYICPNCEKTSGKVTTWLPGCRNRSCRKPARITKKSMSKYCSDKCGLEYMQGEVRRSEEARKAASGKAEKSSRPKRKGITMAEINGDAGGDNSDDDLGPRGGALKASELKALITSVDGDVTAFRNLGAGVLSPPPTASPTNERFPTSTTDQPAAANLTTTEQERIDAIAKEKDDLRRRRTLLKDREKFGQLIRENVARYAEREKVKPKDVCGYDNRLTWSEEEFKQWRESDDGQTTLTTGVLALPDPKDKAEVNGNGVEHMDVDGESPPQQQEEDKKGRAGHTMCTKKRCERHRQWQKQALADVRFEESTLADQMRGLEKEEREMRELGALRGRMEKGGLAGEGSVEVVGAASS